MEKRVFNVSGDCKPNLHYMVDITSKLEQIRAMVDKGQYFAINRARQFGKTTTLRALNRYLRHDYYPISMDFQTFGAGEFENENIFALSFARSFLRILKRVFDPEERKRTEAVRNLENIVEAENPRFRLQRLFEELSDICGAADKPVVLMIDEVDSASNNQVFLDFLAQLRAYYIDRDVQPTFWSVILAGVYDVKNIRQRIRPEEAHKVNSPWNIAADFKVEMSFSKEEIEGMLRQYENDWHTGMDMEKIAGLLYDYTSGYPFLVSRLCKIIDEDVSREKLFYSKSSAWTEAGFHEALRMLIAEKNTLFESLTGKLTGDTELNGMLQALLFNGKSIVYNADDPAIDMAVMLGFVKNHHGNMVIANRIFETRLYNMYLSAGELQRQEIYKASLLDKSQFIVSGHLNMRRVLEKFVEHFDELYHDSDENFVEEIGRKFFLLYLKPIINGTGNYYIETRTRSLGRTDVIVDYCGQQFVIELKIWHGNEYHMRGERQLLGYLEDYHIDKGYMLSFNFNKKKQIGVREIVIGDKILIEAVV